MKEEKPAQVWVPVENDDMHCFACGKENRYGLKMGFESNGEKLRSGIIVPEHLRGWENLVHGGIISTILDEAMSWAAIHLHKHFILTKSMQVNFKKPVKVSEKIWVYSHVLEKNSKRHLTMQADIYDKTGDICASGTGEFVLFTTEQFSNLNIMDSRSVEKRAKNLIE